MAKDLPRIPGPSRAVYSRSGTEISGPTRRKGRRRSGRRHGGGQVRATFEARRGRRWPKRLGIAILCLVLLIVLAGVGGYFYLDSKLGAIRRLAVPALSPQKPGQPIDVLMIGSDSRAFVDTKQQQSSFGSKATQTGQRSDVVIIARLVPATSSVEMLSIPRDTYVAIAGTGGSNRINAAFNSGANQLVQTIEQDFKIPINHVMEVNFPGFAGMVDSLGGLSLDFPMPVRDTFSGLNIAHAGCQVVNGAQSLALVRSRHLYYFEKGSWHYDTMSDWSRIRRQQAFFHALLDKVHGVFPNIFTLSSFLSSAVGNLAVDSKLSSSEMMSLGLEYRSLSSSSLTTSVLPTTPSVMDGADVLLPAQPYAADAVRQFLSAGGSGSALAGSSGSALAGSSGSALAGGSGSALGSGRLADRGAHRGGTVLMSSLAPPSGVVTDTPQSLPEPWNPVPC
ncbi:MAG: LCP family protein [Acidimicrobiales bacterium]